MIIGNRICKAVVWENYVKPDLLNMYIVSIQEPVYCKAVILRGNDYHSIQQKFYYRTQNLLFQLIRLETNFYTVQNQNHALNLIALRVAASPKIPTSHPKDSYKDNFRGQQCQFKCGTNLGCLRRLFRVTILEDGMIELSLSTDDKLQLSELFKKK
ncbi:Hypothetical_protein [Hexamita inflata]|uniref:Hypothetical_protein n=1 Tax=Hexamita inflata TaxID=28002 RepID=A0AA86N4C9_9EUKA|nr:Hypothetical protein HINF_LOCUS339 [Hexamita inflata]